MYSGKEMSENIEISKKKIVAITLPHCFEDETVICNSLFVRGLERLHLRKPDSSEEVYEEFIGRIEPRYRARLVIHNYFHLAEKYRLRGIHLSSSLYRSFRDFDKYRFVSVSCHSVEEIEELHPQVSECFLSPIFDSITKEGYLGAFDHRLLAERLPRIDKPVVALGGISADNIYSTFALGFAGAALMGGLWGKNATPAFDEVMSNWQSITTPLVMSIAGFDPSSGAGVSADIKTTDSIGAYCFGINTGNTIQNQYELTDIEWLGAEQIKRQIEAIISRNAIRYVKIGIIRSLEILLDICDYLCEKLPDVRICWDPILGSSSGFVLHGSESIRTKQSLLSDILDKIYLITPNYGEAQTLFGNSCSDEEIQRYTDRHGVNILIKGGHRGDESPFVCDSLYSVGGQRSDFRVLRSAQRKHGTGCMLSSAIVAYLAKGFTLRQAIGRGQLYVASNIKKSRGMLFLNAKNDYNTYDFDSIRLMYITHPHPTLSICHQIELACHAGIKLVQLRLKDSGEAELLEYARAAVDICHRHDALLIVNDSVDVCLQADADGVHLGKEDEAVDRARLRLGDDKIIGVTCNTFADVQHAYRMGADYVGIGPFRHTTTKQRLSPILGIDGLADIALQMKAHGMYLPTYAIGGITAADAGSIAECGIHGVAISSAILGSNDFEGCTKKILNALSDNQ